MRVDRNASELAVCRVEKTMMNVILKFEKEELENLRFEVKGNWRSLAELLFLMNEMENYGKFDTYIP